VAPDVKSKRLTAFGTEMGNTYALARPLYRALAPCTECARVLKTVPKDFESVYPAADRSHPVQGHDLFYRLEPTAALPRLVPTAHGCSRDGTTRTLSRSDPRTAHRRSNSGRDEPPSSRCAAVGSCLAENGLFCRPEPAAGASGARAGRPWGRKAPFSTAFDARCATFSRAAAASDLAWFHDQFGQIQ